MITHTLLGGRVFEAKQESQGKTAKTCEKDPPRDVCIYYLPSLKRVLILHVHQLVKSADNGYEGTGP